MSSRKIDSVDNSDTTFADNAENKNDNQFLSFLKKFGLAIFTFLFMVVSWFVTSNINDSRHSDESALFNQITQLKNNINVQQAALADKENMMNQNASGSSNTRKSADDKKITDLMNQATTWSSYAEYTAARSDIEKKYKLTDSSPFMKNFMPVVNTIADSKGKQYNDIDTFHLHVKFDSINTSITKVAATTYSYFALVQVTSSSDNKGAGDTYDVITYDTDANNNIKNINVKLVSGTPSSGGSLSLN